MRGKCTWRERGREGKRLQYLAKGGGGGERGYGTFQRGVGERLWYLSKGGGREAIVPFKGGWERGYGALQRGVGERL